MKKILTAILLFVSLTCMSQQSLIKLNGWNAYVHLPADYSTTKTYPTIIFFPGVGEVGTNASLVIANGPGAYLTQGWNGNVSTGTDSVEFIVISLQPPAAYPVEVTINSQIASLKSLYRIDSKRLYLTGLSEGGWICTTFVTGDPLGGPYTYASQIAAIVNVEGVRPDDNQPYPYLFQNYGKAKGRLCNLEQLQDGRDMPTYTKEMDSTVANSAIYTQTDFGSGGHCCWSNFYGGQGTTPGIFSLDGVNQNIYQWLAKQSLKADTTVPINIVTGCNQLPGKVYTIEGVSDIYDITPNPAWKGGDTIKIAAGNYTDVIEFDHLHGDSCRPITIINSGGLVSTAVMRFKSDCEYLHVTGAGTAGLTYGFRIQQGALTGDYGHNLEFDHIEIDSNKNGVGVYFKTFVDSTNPVTIYTPGQNNYLSNKLHFHHLWIHDVNGEGMYIGHTAPDGGDGQTFLLPNGTYALPLRLDSVEIDNVVCERTAWDGIQLSNARDGAKIHDNIIRHVGLALIGNQWTAIILGGNTSGDVYNNKIDSIAGNGIELLGYGTINCYNNIIDTAGTQNQESIFCNDQPTVSQPGPQQQLNIYSNHIIAPALLGAIRIGAYYKNSLPSNVHDNLVCLLNAPANWLSLYFILNVPGTISTNNLLDPSCQVLPVPVAPKANAGNDTTFTVGGTLNLHGSANQSCSFQWNYISGANVSNTPIAQVSGLTADTYQFVLTANNSTGLIGKDTIKVTVTASPVSAVYTSPYLVITAQKSGSYIFENSNGKILLRGNYNKGTTRINIKKDANGIYILIPTGLQPIKITKAN